MKGNDTVLTNDEPEDISRRLSRIQSNAGKTSRNNKKNNPQIPKPVWYILIVFGLIAGIYLYDTAFNPVVSRLSIIDIHETEQGHSKFKVRFDKFRDCSFVSLAWYEGTRRNGFRRLQLFFDDNEDDSEQSRITGTQIAGYWRVNVPPETLMHRTFAMVRHRCHALYDHQTEIFN